MIAVLLPTQTTATETTNKITNTTSRRIVISAAQTRASQEHPTGNNAPHRQTENGDDAYKNALIAVSVILAVVLVMFFVVLLYLFVQRRRKHLRRPWYHDLVQFSLERAPISSSNLSYFILDLRCFFLFVSLSELNAPLYLDC